MTGSSKPKGQTTEIMNEKENIYVPIKPPNLDSLSKKRKGENSILGTKNIDDHELNEIQDLSLNEASEFSQIESNLLGTLPIADSNDLLVIFVIKEELFFKKRVFILLTLKNKRPK